MWNRIGCVGLLAALCAAAGAQSVRVGADHVAVRSEAAPRLAAGIIGRAFVDARTGQGTLHGGTDRADKLAYDNTVNGQGFYGGQSVDMFMGDQFRGVAAGDLSSITFTLYNGGPSDPNDPNSVGWLVSADLTVQIRDWDNGDIILHEIVMPAFDFTFGGELPNGLEPNHGYFITLENLAGHALPQVFLLGYRLSNMSGGANPVTHNWGQLLYAPQVVGTSRDSFWDNGGDNGALRWWWWGGSPRADFAYAVHVNNDTPANPVYKNENYAGSTYVLDPNTAVFDDLVTTGGGVLTSVDFSVVNGGPVDLVATHVDLDFRTWDHDLQNYVPAGFVTVPLDLSANPLAPGVGTIITVDHLEQLNPQIVVGTDILAGVRFHDHDPVDVTAVGQYVAEIPDVGWSGNAWYQETIGQDPGWWWFGGSPRGSFWWVIRVVSGVPACPGDCNCDGVVDFNDINAFVAVLSGGQPCRFENCDINGDSAIDFNDINAFVAILSGGGGPCP